MPRRPEATDPERQRRTTQHTSAPSGNNKPQLPPASEQFHPSDFMRARHPDLFSDTTTTEHTYLARPILDHHLSTLTNRKEELMFERFARKLAEKELCPNLVPQTGPTGGGDSKVDTETYPVAPEIAHVWYQGSQDAEQERWAFAFSAKKQWKAKVRADVASIAETGRAYTRVYFITNQYVKDKDRGELQDELRQQYGLDVWILDRTWILDKVFTNKREQLAIDTLDLDRPPVLLPTKGPRDTQREAELDELDAQIQDPARYHGIAYQLVEDCLQTALLARGLERPRVEVDGRFERAERIAQQHGTRQQQLRVAYKRAWTLFWWYEDYDTFTQAYDDVERLATTSNQAGDVQLLKNLWHLLYAATQRNTIDNTSAKLADRTATLRAHLQQLQQDKERRTNTLQAKAQELLIDLLDVHDQPEERKRILGEFRAIFEQAKGLVDFPTRDLIDIITELGTVFPDDTAFTEVFDEVVEIAQEREGQATAGSMLLRRGMQLLDQHRPYDATRALGRALQRLALRECRGEFVAALATCAQAYEAAGLLWAAHASMLLAASQALRDFLDEGRVTAQAYACIRRLIWLELQLGRIPCALAYIETATALHHAANLDTARKEGLQDEWLHVDRTLGLLLLKTELFTLRRLTALPATLEQLGLDFSWIALLYALGHEEKLRNEGVFPNEEPADAIRDTFRQGIEQTAGDLPRTPEFLDERKLDLHSNVLGCDVTVTTPNENGSLFLAQAILAGLEAFLATSLDAPLFPRTAKLTITIIPTDYLSTPLEWTVAEDNAHIDIRHPADASIDDHTLHEQLATLIITITTHLALPADITHFETLFRDEEAMGRALVLRGVGTSTGNILGNHPKLRLDDWTNDAETFPLQRTEPWNPTPPPTPQPKQPLKFGTGLPPRELTNTEGLKHKDRRILSVIDTALWDKAGWNGTAYIHYLERDAPPLMVLAFRNFDVGKKIFAGLQHDIGPEDTNNQLRIAIITGIDKNNPAHYRVIIGSSLDGATDTPGSHIVMISRIHKMEPSTSVNLDRFLADFKHSGAYYLAPGHFNPDQTNVDFDTSLTIHCSSLHLRPAWEISENDPDVVAIHDDDDVIIPEHVTDPPIIRTLERIKQRRERATPPRPSTAPKEKVGRNDPCPCGSGKKYKKCCGR